MGFLNEEFTESTTSFEASHGTDIKPHKRGTVSDIATGIVSGTAKGIVSTSNALSRFVEGDEVADKRLHQANQILTPKAQGKAGHIASSIAEPLAGAVAGVPLGPYGMATSAGLSARASTHTYQTQVLGIDQDTADIGSNLSGATMAAMTLVPMSNVLKNGVADYALTVGGTTLAGQVSTYATGAYLDSKGYYKQGQMYKDMSTDPTMIMTGLVVGSAFWGLGRMRHDPNATQQQVNDAQDQAHASVDEAIANTDLSSMPNKPETVADTLQHQVNLNTAIDQIMKGEKVSISEATGGALKTMDDVKQYLNNRTINSTSKLSEALKPKESTPIINSRVDLTATISSKINERVATAYQLSQEVGFSPSQARALVGELGRENGYNLDTMFGSHKDQANHKTNRGIFSWQDAVVGSGRLTNLMNHMRSKGLVNADGTFKRTNESLKQQLVFLKQEIEANPKWKASFLDKKNITNEEARAALGGKGTIIGWARGQSKLKSGDSFDWKAHEATANKFSNMVDGEPTITTRIEDGIESITPIQDIAPQPRSYTDLDSTITRVDLDHPSQVIVDPIDIVAFEQRHSSFLDDLYSMEENNVIKNIDEFDDIFIGRDQTNEQTSKGQAELESLLESLMTSEHTATIPHTAKGVKVKENLNNPNKEFKFDDELQVEWKEKLRYEKDKYHKELTRSYKDKDGNTVQELKYKGSNLARTIDHAGKTISIHVGRSNRSDFVNHKGNKELETALNRIFDTNNYGYLTQIPKGAEAIAKLDANPNLVISSKRTGEDFTAEQWKHNLQREQDNIQTLSKAMLTLAKCALKQAA